MGNVTEREIIIQCKSSDDLPLPDVDVTIGLLVPGRSCTSRYSVRKEFMVCRVAAPHSD